jgi:hypothetical protein
MGRVKEVSGEGDWIRIDVPLRPDWWLPGRAFRVLVHGDALLNIPYSKATSLAREGPELPTTIHPLSGDAR